MRVSAQPQPGQLRCPYCHDPLDRAVAPCPGCETQYHDDCWRELGRCALLGCGGAQAADDEARAAEQRTLWLQFGTAVLMCPLLLLLDWVQGAFGRAPALILLGVAYALGGWAWWRLTRRASARVARGRAR